MNVQEDKKKLRNVDVNHQIYPVKVELFSSKKNEINSV